MAPAIATLFSKVCIFVDSEQNIWKLDLMTLLFQFQCEPSCFTNNSLMPKLEIDQNCRLKLQLKKTIQEALYLDHMALPIRPTPQVIYTTPSVKIIHIYPHPHKVMITIITSETSWTSAPTRLSSLPSPTSSEFLLLFRFIQTKVWNTCESRSAKIVCSSISTLTVANHKCERFLHKI